MSYLAQLLERVNKTSLSEMPAPDAKRDSEDTFIATLSMDLKKLWVATEAAKKVANDLRESMIDKFSDMSDEERLLRQKEGEKMYEEVLMASWSR